VWQLSIPPGIAKNKKELVIPLGDLSAGILLSAMEKHPSGLLFGSPGGTIFKNWSKATKVLWKATGIEGATIHDFRRSFRTNLARSCGVAPHIAERLVGHVSSQSEMSKTYDHWTYWPEMCVAVQRYDQWFRTTILHQRS
jgi:integrase